MAAGKTYLIFGKGSGWAMNTNLSMVDASFFGENENDRLGNSGAGVGDVNGDGYDDILIGAQHYDNRKGKTYLILGKPSGWTINNNLSKADASFIGEHENDNSGWSVSGAGDVNGDGNDDILIGAPYYNNIKGKTYLILGKPSGWALNTSLSKADASFIGEHENDNSGWSVSGAGDVNGNGYDDILIGASWNNDGGIAAGKTYLIFGKPLGWSLDSDLSDVNISFIGERKYDTSGQSVAGVGDVNGDGYSDILIGAPSTVDYNTEGTSYLILGKPSGWAKNINLSKADASFTGEHPNDYSGWTVAGAGDANGDGFDDILINCECNTLSGKTYLIFMDSNSKPSSINSVKAYSNENYSTEIKYAKENERIFIELQGIDGNSSRNDTALVKVLNSASDPIGFILRLMETEKNTGVYRGNFTIKNRTHTSYHWIGAFDGDTIKVSSIQDPSKFVSIGVGMAILPHKNPIYINEDEPLIIHFWAVGPEPKIWNVIANDKWLHWDSRNQNLSGIPNNANVGKHWVNITVSVSGFTSKYFNYTVIVNNTPPGIITKDMTTVLQDHYYFVDYNSTDDDEGIITWHLKTNASGWLSINSSTGYLAGTPLNKDVGKYYVNVSVDDENGGWAYSNFTLMVVNINDAPVITSKDNGTAYQDIPYSVQYTAQDVDIGDVLTWNLETNAGNWLHINSITGLLSGTPTNDDVGTYWVKVTVKDIALAYDFSNFTLTVVNVNDPPKITSIPVITATIHVEYKYQVTAVDIDIGDVLEYSLDAKPDGMTIDNKTGLIKWTPSKIQKGNNYVVIRVSDGKSAVLQSFNINVPNHKPVVSTIPDQTVTVEDKFKYQVKANDSDLGDILKYSINNIPAGMSISSTGLITWAPDNGQIGKHTISVKVSDGMDSTVVYFNMTVKKKETIFGFTNLDTLLFVIIVIAIIVLVVIVVLYNLRRKIYNSSSKKVKKANIPHQKIRKKSMGKKTSKKVRHPKRRGTQKGP